MRDLAEGDLTAQAPTEPIGLSWLGVLRLGLVQTALGAIIVLSTSLLNRVMAVELGLLQALPGALIALHYIVQMSRPRWGYGSDVGAGRTSWIIGGMAVLALGGAGAALATAWISVAPAPGIAAAVAAFVLIGVGAGAAGTSLLALLASEVAPARRGAAASIVWTMMIAGFVVTAITAGALLEPFSFERMVTVSSTVCAVAFIVATLAVWGIERPLRRRRPIRNCDVTDARDAASFRDALRDVWREPAARRFTLFVFVAMLAYQAQDPILEPFAGLVFDYSVKASTQLSGVHHGGVLVGMIGVAAVTLAARGRALGGLGLWTVAGCAASGLALIGLSASGVLGLAGAVTPLVFVLGVSNGAFAVAAIGSMMALAGAGRRSKEGVRMGVWGAAQALAFGLAGLMASVAADGARAALGDPAAGYGVVFLAEAGLFALAALIALRIETPRGARLGPLSGDAESAELALAAAPSPARG